MSAAREEKTSEEQRTAHLERLNPAELAPPRGFTHAVTAEGGRLVFLAGQTGTDGTGKVVEGGLVAQFDRALTNLLTALAATGGGPADLARVTVYTTDVAAYRASAGELGAVWRRLAGRDYPAMALIGAVRLWDEEAVVELDGLAVLPREKT
ncbi:RidA family protein [Streptomyces sp. I05A-00742]|uniref:RidA family protein n=1 Tax=Streptomyces sp. I05A-00742 TaxID=2732853 RepID=UPI001488336B|nr:RidA family protein [Streptomyces sp. I05A-00742]